MLELRDTWLDQIGNELIIDTRGFQNSPAALSTYPGRYSNSKQQPGHQRAAKTYYKPFTVNSRTYHKPFTVNLTPSLQPLHAFDSWCSDFCANIKVRYVSLSELTPSRHDECRPSESEHSPPDLDTI
ncbi:hypothetical protein AZE42_07530 [Rhizopogon vesiculosus]|uniref:Uncharacterized protein n=1 Tax=Rhizopogon vesiculosus TaxID=180088 RepID=A0A1J8PNM8_9AGAM|nr:hypothetical protein AZE42_07530 [Rhizopogon vesiculosus]